MSKKNHRLWAYIWLAFIFCFICAGQYFFFRFSFDALNPIRVTRGLAVASTLWCGVLMSAMLLHRAWARYILITWLVFSMVAFGAGLLMMNSQSIAKLPQPTKAAVIGLMMYAIALIPLGMSRSLQRYLAPRSAGGE